MKDYMPRLPDRSGLAFAGAGVGILLLWCVIYLGGQVWGVNGQKEGKELEERLVQTKVLNRYLEYVASVRLEENHGRRGDLFGMAPWPRVWSVERTEGGSTGHFTFAVSGWKRVRTSERTNESFVVRFEKREGQPIEIIRIETWCPELSDKRR
ncbi:MAG: hypothetical protein IPL39_02565 [Opitutaceae bacterium]|nr:hypothetical protein [Opitutaceae bacterium]